jgi:hypothetical protein
MVIWISVVLAVMFSEFCVDLYRFKSGAFFLCFFVLILLYWIARKIIDYFGWYWIAKKFSDYFRWRF